MGTRTARRRVIGVLIGTATFLAVGAVAGLSIGAPIGNSLYVSLIVGGLVCAFEAFYVQGSVGNRFRAMSPLLHVAIYAGAVVCFYAIAIVSLAELLATADAAAAIYGRIGRSLPAVFVIAAFCVLVVRVVSFLGARNLFALLIGRYQRPIIEARVFAFIDLKDSTAITERLGPQRARQLIAQFLFDLSRPITDHRGDIYKYMGDGLIATWTWDAAIEDGNVLRAMVEAAEVIRRRGPIYQARYGVSPEFRAGVHGGDVVVSEQGDLRRAIEYNGDAINIAARLEGKAKELGQGTLVSGAVADAISPGLFSLTPLDSEMVKGYSLPIAIYGLTGPIVR